MSYTLKQFLQVCQCTAVRGFLSPQKKVGSYIRVEWTSQVQLQLQLQSMSPYFQFQQIPPQQFFIAKFILGRNCSSCWSKHNNLHIKQKEALKEWRTKKAIGIFHEQDKISKINCLYKLIYAKKQNGSAIT